MKVTYKKDINHTYLLFQGKTIHTETFQVQMLLHNLVEGLLPCSMISLNEEDIWRCECTGMPSLDVFCKTKELGKDDFVWIVYQLLENIQELQDYLLDVNHLYLLPEHIYIHPEKNKILCCLVPFYDNDIWSSLKQVLQFLLQYLNPQDEGVASMAYGLFRMLSKEDCSMELLWGFLYEKQHIWRFGKNSYQNSGGFIQLWNPQKEFEHERDSRKEKEVEYEKDVLHEKEVKHEKDALQEGDSGILLFDGGVDGNENEKYGHKEELLHRFLGERENNTEGSKNTFWLKDIKNKDFWKRISYLFPALIAIALFIYLVFNSWTMSGRILLVYAGTIVGFQIVSVVLYWCWGREIEEVNPVMKEYEEEALLKDLKSQSESKRGNSHNITRKDDNYKKGGMMVKEQYKEDRLFGSWSEEFEKKIFAHRTFGFSEGDDCTVLLQETKEQKHFLYRVDTNERYEIKEGETTIGKSKERVQIRLSQATVSRIHAMITRQDTICYLQDLNSKNGTYINGERLSIRSNYILKAGDEITIADICFIFK